jgi:hypothetical protein
MGRVGGFYFLFFIYVSCLNEDVISCLKAVFIESFNIGMKTALFFNELWMGTKMVVKDFLYTP